MIAVIFDALSWLFVNLFISLLFHFGVRRLLSDYEKQKIYIENLKNNNLPYLMAEKFTNFFFKFSIKALTVGKWLFIILAILFVARVFVADYYNFDYRLSLANHSAKEVSVS